MSKTDKTRPWWVRMADAPMVTCVPVHDHRFGICTLPDEITTAGASLNHRTSGCYWRATDHHLLGAGALGGGREWNDLRREERRRSRRRARRDLRKYRDDRA
ncbi:hypothetical protein SAMN05444920_11967 [Nonomuraea solani]|uniref:Uncharacterized protein n=1 Tax=Nonomuraea solani TaxID=1144553 RepID=A0A1H6ETD7_9ACTN|nr:hypothetical protein [Nonomuraea solani]SEH01137.1 hypothetical protein SAMN05444920_11967 [Nonomuraea solani]